MRILRPQLLSNARRTLATKAPPPPVDPHPFISQINNSSGRGTTTGAGPFPIGSIGGNLDRDAQVKAAGRKWQQLKTSEKGHFLLSLPARLHSLTRLHDVVGVAFTQSTSLLVVAFGAGLAGLVIYATGTELFATNSPTRIFEDCVERVKANPEVITPFSRNRRENAKRSSVQINALLLAPLSFHGQNSSNRLRRNRRISSSLSTDSSGRETMIVRFWVEGTPLPVEGEDVYWFDTVKQWIGPLVYEDSSNPGAYVPRPTFPKVEPSPPLPLPQQSWASWVGVGVLSLFGGLIPNLGSKKAGENTPVQSNMFKRASRPAPGEHFTGEAVAELKKVRLIPLSFRFRAVIDGLALFFSSRTSELRHYARSISSRSLDHFRARRIRPQETSSTRSSTSTFRTRAHHSPTA